MSAPIFETETMYVESGPCDALWLYVCRTDADGNSAEHGAALSKAEAGLLRDALTAWLSTQRARRS